MSDSPVDPRRIRRRMRELELSTDGSPERSYAAAISETLLLSEPGGTIDGQLLAALQSEIERAMATRISGFEEVTPRNLCSLGFLHGVTFAVAVRDLLDAVRDRTRVDKP